MNESMRADSYCVRVRVMAKVFEWERLDGGFVNCMYLPNFPLICVQMFSSSSGYIGALRLQTK